MKIKPTEQTLQITRVKALPSPCLNWYNENANSIATQYITMLDQCTTPECMFEAANWYGNQMQLITTAWLVCEYMTYYQIIVLN